MKRKNSLPFQGLTPGNWVNLLLVALATYSIISFILPLLQDDWCRAVDYCGYYGAGLAMNAGKLADVYNSDILGRYQSALFTALNASDRYTEVISMVYLPVFMAPFKFLAQFQYSVSLLIWYLTNFVLLTAYLVFFYTKVSGKKPGFRILALLVVSYPVLLNFNYGQVNVWLVICFAEFLRAIVNGKPFRSGLWLGGWLLKPQLLVLILPFLLIQKKYKALWGFIASSALLFGVSFLLVGWEGMLSFKDIILESARGGATSHYEYMMDWRMLSFYLSYFTSPTVGWVFLGLTSAATAAAPLIVFRKTMAVDSPRFAIALLSITAATTLVSYHAHLHTAMILIPILLYLFIKGLMERKRILLWVAIPYGINLALYLIGVLILGDVLPAGFGAFIEIAFGGGMLINNLILFIWALTQRCLFLTWIYQ